MKKWLVLLLSATIMLSACGKSDERASLEKDIKQLQKENDDLKSQKKDLEKQKEKLNDQREKLQKEVDESVAHESSKQVQMMRIKRVMIVRVNLPMIQAMLVHLKVVCRLMTSQIVIRKV